mgnify:CR=1 FL=1
MNKAVAASPSVLDAAAPPRMRRRGRSYEGVVRGALAASGAVVVVATVAMLGYLTWAGVRGIQAAGLGELLFGTRWRPEEGLFGGAPLLVGTLTSALGAVFVGAVPAVLTAIWLTELAPPGVKQGYRRLMEVASALPSVVYGWLALMHLVPLMGRVAAALHPAHERVGGEGLATASVLLGVMIAPTVLLLSLDALARVPQPLREASLALGGSVLDTAFRVVLPCAWRGVVVAVFFGFARAAGETMAVQMVIGGARQLPSTLFSPTTTISTQVVMDMQNARPHTPEHDVLFAMSLVLLVLSTIIVLFTRAIARGRP